MLNGTQMISLNYLRLIDMKEILNGLYLQRMAFKGVIERVKDEDLKGRMITLCINQKFDMNVYYGNPDTELDHNSLRREWNSLFEELKEKQPSLTEEVNMFINQNKT